jgi:hypothetical protein
MRDLKREHAIITELLRDALEVGHWTNESTKEYIRNHMLGNVYFDWFPHEWKPRNGL